MSHGINAYYRNTITTPAAVQQTGAARPAAPATSVRELAAARAAQQTAQSGDLSDAEAQMIDRYFPPSDAMSLRLYGPGAGARTLTPAAVGSKLDIQG